MCELGELGELGAGVTGVSVGVEDTGSS